MNELNPKFPRSSKRFAKNELYKYYAGFSEEFIEDIINQLIIDKDKIIFDPWNGSGTTTYVATKLGYNSIGIDINPVMLILAKARLYKTTYDDEYLTNIFKQARKYRTRVNDNDLLTKWFDNKTIGYFRNIERAILKGKKISLFIDNLDILKHEECFFILVLINTIKRFTKSLKSTNPSWIKQSNLAVKDKIFAKREEIENMFYEELLVSSNLINIKNPDIDSNRCSLNIADSEDTNLDDNSIDCIITSPPYCTRIDYAVLTNIELALLGISQNEFDSLRHKLIGGPVIHSHLPELLDIWGETCKITLNQIKNHYSKASESYYYKTYIQYFDSMYKSFKEMDRILKSSSYCIMVVQNSFYKDIYIDLCKIFKEFALNFNWRLIQVHDFNASKNLTRTNKNSKLYPKNRIIKEYALVFLKEEM